MIAVAVGASLVPVTVTSKLAFVVTPPTPSSVTVYSTRTSLVSPSPKSSKLPSFKVKVAAPSIKVKRVGMDSRTPSTNTSTVPGIIDTSSPSMSTALASRSTMTASPSSTTSTSLLSTVGASFTAPTMKLISALLIASPSVME